MEKGQHYMLGACGILLLLSANPATAEETLQNTSMLASAFNTVQDGLDLIVPDSLTRDGWRVRLGAGFGSLPDYSGSDDYRLKALPIIDIRYGQRWRLSFNKLSYAFYAEDNWEIGPFIKYKSGRKQTRNPALMGLGDISATLQVGAFARYKDKRKLFSAEVRQALAENQGASIRVTFGHGLYQQGAFKLAAALRGKWMSEKAMQTNYGINAEQASASTTEFAAFRPSAGVSELSLDVLARYDVRDTHRLLGLVSYGRLMGDAANSPLVAEGSRNQLKIGVGFTIDF